jgi:hypothetical protein
MRPVINLDRFWKFCSALRITDKENPDGLVPLIPFKTQTYVVNEIAAGLEEGIHKFVILKFRQAGMTTIGLALDLYWLNKFPGLPGTFVADSDSNREHFRAIIDEYIKSVAGGHWHIGLKHHNRNHLILDNRSRLTYQVASSRNDRLGQGKGMSFGHFSECSSWDNDEGLMSLNASLAETNPSRLYIYESTAQGYNLWHDMWKDAKNSMAQKAIFLGWWMHERYVVKKDSNIYRVYWDGKLDADERMWVKHVKSLYDHDVTPEQMAWWRFTLAEKFHSDLTMMKQEFPPTEHDAFQMSGAKFFDGVKVNEAAQALKNDKYQSYKFEIGQKWDESRIMPTIPRYAELKMWEGPKDGAVYVVSGDPAYGSSEWKDNFCAQVFKCYADGMEQVAEYASAQCSTQAFAWLLCYLAGFYKNSTLIIEINGPGQFVWNEVLNLRRTATGQKSVDGRSFIGSIQMFLYRRIDAMGATAAYQWKSTHELKVGMLTGFKDYFESGRIKLRSLALCEELVKVVRMDDGDLRADGRGKDDRVIAAAMATVPWLRSLKTQLIARGMTREQAIKREEVAPEVTALQAAVTQHFQDIGYQPKQIKLH